MLRNLMSNVRCIWMLRCLGFKCRGVCRISCGAAWMLKCLGVSWWGIWMLRCLWVWWRLYGCQLPLRLGAAMRGWQNIRLPGIYPIRGFRMLRRLNVQFCDCGAGLPDSKEATNTGCNLQHPDFPVLDIWTGRHGRSVSERCSKQRVHSSDSRIREVWAREIKLPSKSQTLRKVPQ